MLISSIRELLTGNPTYHARSPWRPVPAVVATVIIIVVAGFLATALIGSLEFSPSLPVTYPDILPLDRERIWRMAVWLLAMQTIIVLLVLAASSMFGGRVAEVLVLDTRVPGRLFLAAVVIMFLAQAVYNAIVLPFAHETVVDDVRPLVEPLESDAFWVFALALVVGAPVSEEILFRGFLLSALAQSRLGFFGAAMVTTLAWTVLHAGYSGIGLIEVFLAGLLFSWLLWRTGSLWVPLVCHGIYNGVVTIAILVLPL
ncbi:MAG: type II CAAX endopeptidase family protein [Hyphomicrobiaceae bacterium]